MYKRSHYLLEKQAQVKVIARTENNTADAIKFSLLATFFAGIFYFFGFGNNLWYALTGG